jgi:hypothetical protein
MNFTLIPPLSTSEGRKYLEALPKITPENNGAFVGVGFPEDYILYRAHLNIDPKTQEDKSNWAYVYSNNWYTRGIANAVEKARGVEAPWPFN